MFPRVMKVFIKLLLSILQPSISYEEAQKSYGTKAFVVLKARKP